MSEPYVANISSVQDFMQCRFRWVCRWLHNRVPLNDAPALTQGKILHQIFEDHLTGKFTMEQSSAHHIAIAHEALCQMRPDEPGRVSLEKVVQALQDLSEPLALWEDKWEYEIPVLEVEEPFEIAHPMDPHFRIKGRPDRRAVMQGLQWHVQNRGLAPAMNFGTYMELATRHYHEHVYALAGAEKYPQYPVGGTLMNLVRKLKYRTNVGKKNEAVKTLDQMFFQHPLVIDLKSPLHDHVMLSLLGHMQEMERVAREFFTDGTLPSPNEKMNGGFNGSTIDPYFRVMCGTADLFDDRLFKERTDTYAPVTDEQTD